METMLYAVRPQGAGYHIRLRMCDQPVIRVGRAARACTELAGADTQHEGYGVCQQHGGNIKRIERAWAMALQVAGELNVSPWDALLIEVRRSANRCSWIDAQLSEAVRDNETRNAAERGLDDPDAIPLAVRGLPAGVRKLMEESRAERRHLAVVAKAAIDAGVAERLVRNVEMEGRLVAAAIVAGLDVLQLTPEQRIEAITRAHARLLELEPGND